MDASFTLIYNKLIAEYFAYGVTAARFFGAMGIFPVLGASYFSRFLKMLLGLAFALVIFPSLDTTAITQASNLIKFFYIFKEYFVGLVIGFVLSLPIWLIQCVGNFIDNQRGEQMGAVVSNLTQQPSSSVGRLLLQSFVVYFLSMNGLIFFVGFVYKSFSIFPLSDFWPILDPHMIENYIGLFKYFMIWVVLLAMPVVVLMFIVEVVLGLLSTFLPQLNVTVLSLPIKSAVGMLVLIIYLHNLYQFTLFHFLDKIKGVYV